MSVQDSADSRDWTMGKVALATVTVLAIVGVAALLIDLARFILLVFAAVVLSVIFDALTRQFCRIPYITRGPALALSVLLLIGVFAGVFTMFGSQLVREFDTIRDSIPRAMQDIENLLDQIGLGETARSLVEQGGSDLSSLASTAGGYLLAAGNGVSDLVLVFVGAIFIASDPAVYRRGFLLLIPGPAEQTAGETLDDASHGLHGWMVGQAVSSVLVAILTWGGLQLLGVPAAGGLGLIAGLLDVIPMIGPIIAGVPAVLLAFTVSPITALWTVLLFLLVQQLQGNFLQPMIQKQAVNVPPAVLLFAVLGAGMVFGPLGVLLAAPITIVLFVAIQRIYVRTLLGKDIKVAGTQE
ncbi:AI-2E family transporter [Altericroceibacterium endophyticum]|uniref:AI-2E family transporter n=1 Tax=Altericroceibacterium endophyticum TaxID=1808508 RepID=A0A6I4T305_9SPHN|nr:AI-2E family transporter [Altericroceibacterium endophyticum]MXO64370.1 AI-2E family transporter [Altericroceibacterium endophyticum]